MLIYIRVMSWLLHIIASQFTRVCKFLPLSSAESIVYN